MTFLPLFVFLGIFLGSGIYFHLSGVDFAFYQVSPAVAILPALMTAIFLYKGSFEKKVNSLIEGMRHRDILTMVIIFLLAGAFGEVTKSIGAVEATVHFFLNMLPQSTLLAGVFLISSLVSVAIGSSMGVVAVVTPLAVGIAGEAGLPLPISVGAVIGGAMFGDNLSFISDTTIAAIQTQKAPLKKKFLFNAPISLISGAIIFIALLFACTPEAIIATKSVAFTKIIPYLVIFGLALSGMHVFLVLILGMTTAVSIGMLSESYTLVSAAKDIYRGFQGMNEIMILSLLVGGLSGLMRDEGCIQLLLEKLEKILENGSKRMANLAIAFISSITDILVANNTIAIILSGEVAKHLSKIHRIPSHEAATWLDIFSCVFQGIIPYGAQILLASSISGLSPLSLSLQVHYCYVLGAVSLLFILFDGKGLSLRRT